MVVFLAATVLLQSGAAVAVDTTDFPGDLGRGYGVAIPFEGYTDENGNPMPISGAVGVDLVLGSLEHPYLPCKNYDRATGTGDTYVNACEERGSYTTYTRFPAGGGLLFPNGYFMGNTQRDLVHGGTVRTYWGARAVNLSVEMYPQRGYDSTYIHPRFDVSVFNHHAHGWTYSAPVGRIALATLDDPGTTLLAGTLSDAGKPVTEGRVHITIFGGSARSSTGYPISSFGFGTTPRPGIWVSQPMYVGAQRLEVVDNQTHWLCVINRPYVGRAGARVDLDLSKPGFGNPGADCSAP